MAYPPGTLFDAMTGFPVEPVSADSFNALCQNCGQRRGNHSTDGSGTRCSENPKHTGNGDNAQWSKTLRFKATDPPQYRPNGWYKCQEYVVGKSLKDIVQEANSQPAPAFKGGKWKTRKEKKKAGTKPWEEQKFNTSKESKGEIKYYKPVPEPKEVEPVPEVDGVTVYKEVGDNYYKLKQIAYEKSIAFGTMFGGLDTEVVPPKTAAGTDIQEAAGSLKGVNVKPYDQFSGLGYEQAYSYYGQQVSQLQQYGEEARREQGLLQLVEDFTNRYGRGLGPDRFGKYILEFAEKEGYRYGYTNREVSSLRKELTTREMYHHQIRAANRDLKAELEALKTQMAGMVQKATPKMPRNFECNGRKFKES